MALARPTPRTLLFVHSSDDMYGADLILLQLVTGLDRRRFRAVVVLPDDVVQAGTLSQRLEAAEIPVRHLRLAVLRRQFLTPWGLVVFLSRLCRSTFALARLIRREAVDLVHSHTSAVIPGALAARLTRTPHVWQTLEIIVRPRFLWRTTSWMLPRLSRRVVAASGPTRDHLCAGDRLNLTRSVVFHNGVDRARIEGGRGQGRRIRAEFGVRPDQPFIGLVGRISRWKGQEYFLQVAAQVVRTHPDARFLIAGSPFHGQERLLEHIRSVAQDLGLADRVALTGFRDDVPAILDALDIVVMSSTLPDPFPSTVLEAMAAGRPVVANAHGGCVEMIVPGTTGLLVEPGRPEAMAEAVRRLVDDPAERQRMGQAGLDRVRAEFSVDVFVQKWTNLYDEVLREAPPARGTGFPWRDRDEAATALRRAEQETEQAERDFAQALQFAVGNGNRQGQHARRLAARRLARAWKQKAKAEARFRRLGGASPPSRAP